MARPKTSQVITLRIPFEDYVKLLEHYGKIAPKLRELIKDSFNKSNEIEIHLNEELKDKWLKLPQQIREQGLRAYIKNAIKIFGVKKDE